MIIAGTGTRRLAKDPKKMVLVTNFLTKALETLSGTLASNSAVLCGMSEGFDEALARACIATGTPFNAYVPNKTYGEYYWGRTSVTGTNRMAEFENLLSQATLIIYCADSVYVTYGGKRVHANIYRNWLMVEHATQLWSYDDGQPSRGTDSCTKYAHDEGLSVLTIHEKDIVKTDG